MQCFPLLLAVVVVVAAAVTFRGSCCKLRKCQTCRLSVASQACVINRTKPQHGQQYPSAYHLKVGRRRRDLERRRCGSSQPDAAVAAVWRSGLEPAGTQQTPAGRPASDLWRLLF